MGSFSNSTWKPVYNSYAELTFCYEKLISRDEHDVITKSAISHCKNANQNIT